MTAYSLFLYLHSWLRWVVLALALLSIYKSFVGFRRNKSYPIADRKLAVAFVSSLHVMLMVGIVLYILSPFSSQIFEHTGEVMKDPTLRLWAIEHPFTMILAVVLATIGSVKARRKSIARKKFKTQLIYFSIALLLILSRIPWDAERLLRF